MTKPPRVTAICGGLRSFLGLQAIPAHFRAFGCTSHLINPQLTSQEPHLRYPPTMTGQPSSFRKGHFSRLSCTSETSLRKVFKLYGICSSMYNRPHLRGQGVLSIRATDRTGLKGLRPINRDYPQTRQTATRARPDCRHPMPSPAVPCTTSRPTVWEHENCQPV